MKNSLAIALHIVNLIKLKTTKLRGWMEILDLMIADSMIMQSN